MAATLTDNIFKCIFLNENNRNMIQISVKFVRQSQIENKPAFVQVLACPKQVTSHDMNQW